MPNLTTSFLPKLTDYPLKVEKINGIVKVFDPVRRQYVKLDPEEYVRQQLVQHFIAFHVPLSRIAIEKQLIGSQKRFDLLVCNSAFEPSLIVECKAEHIQISEETIQQISSYNAILNCRCSLITNGSNFIVTAVEPILNWEDFFKYLSN